MGFDIVYLPPIHPIGTVNRKGRNNTLPGGNPVARPATSARRGRSARTRAVTTRSTPSSARFDDFDAFVAAPGTSAWRSRWTWRCSARRPPVGHRASRVVHHAARRHHRVRGEPAEEVPGHLPAQLRQRPGRASTPRSLRVVLLWVEHGVRIFRVDNPHTKPPNFWDWLIWQVKRRPGRAVPRRGVHPARDDARAGPDRLHPVATPTSPGAPAKQEITDYALMHAERADDMRPELLVNTPDILHESLQTGGPPMFAIRAVLAVDAVADLGHVLRIRAVRARAGAAGQRGVPQQREVPAAPARLRRRRGEPAARWSRTSPG